MDMEHEDVYKIHLEIPFPTERYAQIAYDVLRVDKEPKRSQVAKVLAVKDSILIGDFSGPTVRGLRVAINGFFAKVDLVTNTMELFGPPVSKEYKFY